MNPYQIVLADDHNMLRQGIKKLIQESKDSEVVGEVSDGLELLDLLKMNTPHMVILDLSMPNLRGIEATHKIKMIYPEVKILILTMHKRKEYLFHAVSAGADGYLLKEDTDMELFSAIETIRQGGFYVSPLLPSVLTQDLIKTYNGDGKSPGEPLTNREREVLRHIAEGKSSKEIAAVLFISTGTVEHHRAKIMKKLNLKKISHLVKYAIREGYTSDSP